MSAGELVPNLSAHARLVAYQHELAPSPGTEDLVWLATEYARADLAGHGVAAARYTVMDAGIDLDDGGLDVIAGSGHPEATAVVDALATVAGATVPVQQLKISLSGQCWRRVLIAENDLLHLRPGRGMEARDRAGEGPARSPAAAAGMCRRQG
jgi:hypothetical protein